MISNSLEVLFEMRLLYSISVDRSIVAWTGGIPERRCTAHVAVSIILSVLVRRNSSSPCVAYPAHGRIKGD